MAAKFGRLSIIAAVARNRVIGQGNRLPWHLPEDLQHFRRLTMGHAILMGRRTYESIGRPLPGRTTVILSRDPHYRVEGCLTATSLEQALGLCTGDPEVFCVGGAELYAQALPLAGRVYLTEIQREYAGDAFFPELSPQAWEETHREVHTRPDGLEYHFVTYRRKDGE